nr:MAG TPA: hypothetical protein [Caudoviricetes sp.]
MSIASAHPPYLSPPPLSNFFAPTPYLANGCLSYYFWHLCRY